MNILYYKSESYIKFQILKGIGITFSFYIKEKRNKKRCTSHIKTKNIIQGEKEVELLRSYKR